MRQNSIKHLADFGHIPGLKGRIYPQITREPHSLTGIVRNSDFTPSRFGRVMMRKPSR